MNIRFRHVLMEGEPGAGGGGAAAAPPAPDAGAGGAAAPAPQPGGETGSALSTAGAAEWTPDSIPEKFRVKGEDGQLDWQATVRKVDEHRSNLEKRLGSGDIRPKSPDEYKLPDTDVFKSLQLDEAGAKAFRQEAHDMGLSQKQYEAIMGKWATLAPELVNASAQQSADATIASLREVWKTEDEMKSNMQGAYKVVTTLADRAGMSYEDVDKAIGNNPAAIRLFAALSGEIGEDATPASAAGATGGPSSADEYMQTNWAAYSDPQNPQHQAVTAQVNRLRQREAARPRPN
jgi:hypothetical protein